MSKLLGFLLAFQWCIDKLICRCIPPKYLLKYSDASFAASISDVNDFPVESESLACTFNPRSCVAFPTIALAKNEFEVCFIHCRPFNEQIRRVLLNARVGSFARGAFLNTIFVSWWKILIKAVKLIRVELSATYKSALRYCTYSMNWMDKKPNMSFYCFDYSSML